MRTISSVPAARKFFVFDIENQLAGRYTRATVREWWRAIQPFITPFDQVVVASGKPMAQVAIFELPMSQLSYHIRPGIDGADDALTDAVDEAHASGRFGTLVIGSGDHAFTPMARRATAHGMRAWQVLGAAPGARSLRAATSVHARLHLPHTVAEARRSRLRVA